MKFEDAMKQIDGAESVGGQLIVNRGGRNVLVGKSIQGTLIVEDDQEAKGIVDEIDENAVKDGREAAEENEDRSPLSTHPVKATIHGDEPIPNIAGDKQPPPGGAAQAAANRETRRETTEAPKGSDPNTPKANTAETSGDKAGEEAKRLQDADDKTTSSKK